MEYHSRRHAQILPSIYPILFRPPFRIDSGAGSVGNARKSPSIARLHLHCPSHEQLLSNAFSLTTPGLLGIQTDLEFHRSLLQLVRDFYYFIRASQQSTPRPESGTGGRAELLVPVVRFKLRSPCPSSTCTGSRKRYNAPIDSKQNAD